MIVADAGPLIGLARVGLLGLLRSQFGAVTVPRQVFEELKVSSDRPGSRALLEAFEAGWLSVVELRNPPHEEVSQRVADDGETAAILLAEQQGGALLLMDERRGRSAARYRGLSVVGTGGVLLAAQRGGEIESVGWALERLSAAGYRMAPALKTRLLELAGES